MHDDPQRPPEPWWSEDPAEAERRAAEAAGAPPPDPAEAERRAAEAAGALPPDPAEPPPLELWNTVGDVTPWGSVLLILSWALLFASMSAHGELADTAAAIRHGASLNAVPTVTDAWRLLGCTFLHADLAHLFFNSASMVVFGTTVERVFGRAAFATVFVLGGVIASLTSVAWRLHADPIGVHISIGASGALFALAGALLTAAWRLRDRLAVGRARALAAAVLFFAAPAIAQGFRRVGTDNAAHVGGLAAGLVLGAIVPLSPRLGGRGGGLPLTLAGMLAALTLAGVYVIALRGG